MKMSTRAIQNVHHYRNVLILYYLIFLVLIIYFSAIEQITSLDYVAIPSLIYVVITYLLAYIRIRKVYLSEIRNSSSYNQLFRIAKTALAMSISIFVAIVLEIIYVINRDVNLDTPISTQNEFISRLFWLTLCVTCFIICWYLHQLSLEKINSMRNSNIRNQQFSTAGVENSKPVSSTKEDEFAIVSE